MSFIEKYFWVFSTFLVPVLYIVVAMLFYLVLYFWKADELQPNKIQPEEASTAQLQREILFGISSLAIFSITGYSVFLLFKSGLSAIYLEPFKFGFVYLIISFFLMIAFHDTYFYWTHRLLHKPGWYQKIHAIHHHSHNPSPFTSISFHPVEAFLQAAVLPLMVILIPAHPFAIFAFLFFMVYKNVRGHAGFEFTTARHRERRWNALRSYSIHHNHHHAYGRDNYGLYFTIWDRLLRTFRREE